MLDMNWRSTVALLLLGTVMVIMPVSGALSTSSTGPELLTLHDAEVLIYLLPAAHSNRAAGRDINWERELAAELNQADFFYFWVTGTNPPPGVGSVTVGHFAVSKHTGEIWSTVPEEHVESAELRGVQEILRRAHGIDSSTVAKYRGGKPWSK
jgi:hypothetical protein